MALAISGTGNGSLNNLALSANTGTIVDTARAGGIVQVVYSQDTTTTTVQNSTSSDVSLHTQTITPSSSSNKILAICTVFGERNPGVDTKYYYVNLDRDSTRIVTNWGNAMNFRQTNQARTHASISYLDSPATTSEITYKMSGDFSIAATSATFFVYTKTITLMEVVA
jgi:hypothetical protein